MGGIEKQTLLIGEHGLFLGKDKLTRTEIVYVDACSVQSLWCSYKGTRTGS